LIFSDQSFLFIFVKGTGFFRAPRSDPTSTSFAWHFYCWLWNIPQSFDRKFERAFCKDWQLTDFFNVVEQVRRNVGGGPTFMTEFGLCLRNWTNTDRCKFVLDAADAYFTSWAYWDADFYDPDFNVNRPLVDTFSRVYPMATNGVPVRLAYNSTTKHFCYDYKIDLSRLDLKSVPTEIFVPMMQYPGGLDVNVSSNLRWTFSDETSRVLVTVVDYQPSAEFMSATVIIRRKL
jgi:hypothetical protein